VKESDFADKTYVFIVDLNKLLSCLELTTVHIAFAMRVQVFSELFVCFEASVTGFAKKLIVFG
jgi:hypothetical protein